TRTSSRCGRAMNAGSPRRSWARTASGRASWKACSGGSADRSGAGRVPIGEHRVEVVDADEPVVSGQVDGRADADIGVPRGQDRVEVVDIDHAVAAGVARARRWGHDAHEVDGDRVALDGRGERRAVVEGAEGVGRLEGAGEG